MTENTNNIDETKVEQNEPINGDVIKYEWVDEGVLLVYVEKDGVTYVETYDHQSTEVGDVE